MNVKLIIKSIFINSNDVDLNFLSKYVIKTINHIKKMFFLSPDLDIELTNNDNKSIKWILMMLLPYINLSNSKLISQIYSLNDIYTLKEKDVNINSESPKYLISNIQYGRCIRDNNITEIKYENQHIINDYKLLKESINIMSNRLFINWVNVFPYNINN